MISARPKCRAHFNARLPVLAEGRFVGVITRTNLIGALVRNSLKADLLSGFNYEGVRKRLVI